MRRWWLVILLLLSVGINAGLLAAVLARRQPPPPIEAGEPGQPPPRLARLANRLGLEGPQRRRFLAIQWSFFQETSRLRFERGEVHRELRRELTAPNPDPARIEELTQRSAHLHLGLEQALVRNLLSTREILGPEQERLYLDLIGRMRLPEAGLGPGGGGAPPERRPRPWRPRR